MTIILLLGLVFIIYLVSKINNLEYRLGRLEKGGQAQSTSQVTAAAKAPTTAIISSPVPVAQPLKPVSIENTVLKPTTPSNGLEFEFGGKFFTVVGAVAVMLGVGFFLRYAISQNLITETMRVVLGIVVGSALIITGEILRKKYDQYSQIVQGTGIGVFYITFFAAFALYGLVGETTALLLMCAVTLMGVVLALRSNSQHFAAIAQIGAYLTPLLVGALYGNLHELFIYIFVVNIGMLLLALYKTWRGVTLGALFGTSVLFVSWYSISFTESMWPVVVTYLTLYFLTFLSANIYRYFIQKHPSDPNDLALVMFNPLFYFLSCYAVFQNVDSDYAGGLAIILSALYFCIGYLVPEDNQDAKTFHFGVSSIMFLVGVPILLDNQWIAIAWTAFGVVLLNYGVKKNSTTLEYMAHIIIMLAFLRVLIIDVFASSQGPFLLNGRAFSLLVVVGLIAAASYLVHRKDSTQPLGLNPALGTDKGMEVLAIQAHILLVAWIGVEFNQFGFGYWMGITWCLLALLILSISKLTNDFYLRSMAYATAALAILRIVIYDSEQLANTFIPIFNTRALAFIGVAIVLGLMLQMVNKMKSEIGKDEYDLMSKVFFFAMNLVLLWVLSLEVTSYFDKQILTAQKGAAVSLMNAKRVGLSVAWSLYASLMLVLGIAWKSASARLLSISLFTIVIFKVFLYDTANLPDFYRFVSFLSLGLVLLVAGFLYNRFKERIEDFIKAD